MATKDTVHEHSYQHFEDLQMSSKDFYIRLKKLIEEYKYPDVVCTPVTLKEGGTFSSRREYLRISRERHSYFVCASPFGRSFFVSWWLQEDANTAAAVAQKFGTFGKAVANRLESKTYYELDTELMFTSAIKSIIKVSVERLKVEKGFRADNEVIPQ